MRSPPATYALHQSPLFCLRSRSKLARLLGLSVSEMKKLSTCGDSLYKEFDIPKRTGGARHVENPCKPLKRAQARLAKLLSRVTPPDFLFCPVKGRCYVSNAARHVGHRVIRCLDIRKFYPSTPSKRVFWFFHKVLGCERDIAGLLTGLSSYRGHLPTGSPLSPILAYFSFYDLWAAIAAVCTERGLTLSVYVDDVTISGSHVRSSDLWRIKKLIHATKLQYHKEKAFFDYTAEVTGVIVTAAGVQAPHRSHAKLHGSRRELALGGAGTEAVARHAGISGQMNQIRRANQH